MVAWSLATMNLLDGEEVVQFFEAAAQVASEHIQQPPGRHRALNVGLSDSHVPGIGVILGISDSHMHGADRSNELDVSTVHHLVRF